MLGLLNLISFFYDGLSAQKSSQFEYSTLQNVFDCTLSLFSSETLYLPLIPVSFFLGLPEQYYSLTWFLSPILGLVFTPVIGTASDRCVLRWGRRRPFILALCVGALLGVALFLNGSLIGKNGFKAAKLLKMPTADLRCVLCLSNRPFRWR